MDFDKEALRAIINGYAREAGVRSLENQMKKIMRKMAIKIVRAEAKRKTTNGFNIEPGNLKEYLGKPVFTSDRFYERTPVGVATGLAWTAMGGATLYIETIRVKAPKTEMKLTGQAGQVMKESSRSPGATCTARRKYAPEHSVF